MVQLLLLMNLLAVGLVFLFALNIYFGLRYLSSKCDDLEKELTKKEAEFFELKAEVERLSSAIALLRSEVRKVLEERTGGSKA